MLKKNILKSNTKGFTLVEMMIYLSLMTIIAIVIVHTLVVVLKSNRNSFTENIIRNAGYGAMEAMNRGIHGSDNILVISSGMLQMSQINPTKIVQFSTSSEGRLNLYEGLVSNNLSLLGPLTSKDVVVKSLIFKPISTLKSKAVRIEMNLTTTVDNQTKSEWFYNTVILRGSY